jgi:tRNA pseudouridine55 synthase
VAEGFLLVDKPGGITSHDVVSRLRRLLGERRIGHAGTLDPMATGLLVVAVGRVTRLLRFVQGQPKEYRATAVLGVATDTLDADGATLTREPMPVSEAEVQAAATRFVGRIHQVPPMVSAIRVGGRRLHELAREGKEVDREAREVEIYSLEVTDFSPCDYPEVSFTVRCSTGTYVRTLADDIGRALGGRAHLSVLRRTAIGSLRTDAATPLEDLEERDADAAREALIPAATALGDLPAVEVAAETARGVRHGTPFAAAALGLDPEFRGPVRVLEDGTLLAVYGSDGRKARPEVVLS